jgi:hemolysin III
MSRVQSKGEEIANSITHGAGLLAGLVGIPVLVLSAMPRGASAVVGASVFAATVVALYLASTLYHSLPPHRGKALFRILDHGSIYLLIAGSYTPFTLGVLRGKFGWTLLVLIWTIAVVGIALKSRSGFRYPKLSTVLYLAMGWLIVVAGKELWDKMPHWGLFWLAAGGVAYTGGVLFYVLDRYKYLHFVWHLCVLTGTACHFIAVLRYSS